MDIALVDALLGNNALVGIIIQVMEAKTRATVL
jgi:adenosylcobinamide amidohydrolase